MENLEMTKSAVFGLRYLEEEEVEATGVIGCMMVQNVSPSAMAPTKTDSCGDDQDDYA